MPAHRVRDDFGFRPATLKSLDDSYCARAPKVTVVVRVRKYFGEHPDADLARCYCTGGEPRRLARLGFDFAFWMGIFASHPVPIIEH